MTLVELLEQGEAARPATCIPDGPTVTYDSLRSQVYSLAGELRGLGINARRSSRYRAAQWSGGHNSLPGRYRFRCHCRASELGLHDR